MFKIDYQKNVNDRLFNNLEKYLNVYNIQNYIPLYNKYFKLNETNYNSINLNNKYSICKITDVSDVSNTFVSYFKDCCGNIINQPKKEIFVKYSPLLDPFKYMIGKYDISNNSIFKLPSYLDINNVDVNTKIIDSNNSAYVDGFFSYLTSNLLNHNGFLNGIDFYGSYLCFKRDFIVNIEDEIEYIFNSDFFNKNNDNLFKLNNEYHKEILNFDSRNNKKRLNIKNISMNANILEYSEIGDDIQELLVDDTYSYENNSLELLNDLEVINIDDIDDQENKDINSKRLKVNKSNSHSGSNSGSTSCSSRTSNTNSDDMLDLDKMDLDDDDNSSKYGSESSEHSYSTVSSNENVDVTIFNFPVEIILLEKCKNTLDNLIVEKLIDHKEWASMLMQVIMSLITYQKIFNFTHNDLHTNNIMFIETNKKYLYYKYDSKYYQVPTYGKIFKIIDFGRAIYKYNGEIICSDSFSLSGDASTQYNFEPYFNSNKPHVEPNYSFDLCRLACSLYDFIIDNDDIKDKELIKIIKEWCSDDKNKNVLYKSNGDERYPDFKLYKMIARTVHNHIPKEQLNKKYFSQFKIARSSIPRDKPIINIDNIPIYV